MASYVEHKQFRGRLTFCFPTPENGLKRLEGFVIVALSGASGIPEGEIKVVKCESRLDSRKTIVILIVEATSEMEGWERVSKLRKIVSDPQSTLNTIGHMKKVFTGATLHVFEPGESVKSNKGKIPVRYREDAPIDPYIEPHPPLSFVRADQTSHARDPRPLDSPKHRLPPDAVHIPFDVVVIPPGVRSPPESPKRELHFHLPGPTRTIERQEEKEVEINLIDMSQLMAVINSPKPVIPETLLLLTRQNANKLKS
jgi:hypothetical protein